MNETEIKKAIELKSWKVYYQLCESHHLGTVADLRIDFTLRGKNGGMAYLQRNEVNFNFILASENFDEYINQVVPHEVCHIVAFLIYGYREHGHGIYWKALMRECGCKPDRCHNMNIANVKKNHVQKFIYRCDCRTFDVSKRLHNSMQESLKNSWMHTTGRRCRHCKKELTYVAPASDFESSNIGA